MFIETQKNNFKTQYCHPNDDYQIRCDRKEFRNLLDEFNLNPKSNYDENLFKILLSLKDGFILDQDQESWLFNHGNSIYLNATVKNRFFHNQAQSYFQNFEMNSDYCLLIKSCESYIKADEPNKALEILDYHASVAESENIEVLNGYFKTKAKVEITLSRYDTALINAEKAYRTLNEDKETLLILAKIHFLKGNATQVLLWNKEARKNGVDYIDIHENMKSSIRFIHKKTLFDVVKNILASDYDRYKYLRSVLPKKMQSSLHLT